MHFLNHIKFLFMTAFLLLSSSIYANSILVMGDSLSAAYNLKLDQGWVSLLENTADFQDTNYAIINASVSGETSQGGVARLNKLLTTHQPTIVILELGSNDGLRGYPLNKTKANLETMIQQSINHGASVLLIGNRMPPNYGKRYTEQFFTLYQALAEQFNIESYLPFMLDNVALNDDLMLEDGLHPNPEGQKQVLQNIMPFLMPMLSK
ncbi:arylesterase [Marinomonas sp. 15G1-11]|uniref:Arylesterase n=1 Tax=Marinomonas phaeophyticola TaxID=3004091 RepID=A0ABT4JPJ9_9GAMM|nr:arylesterase [Marinomonas sp. 15G1-11]MCZ2720292.1 arylesterase [Marinomonas sp. 15G1-11]